MMFRLLLLLIGICIPKAIFTMEKEQYNNVQQSNDEKKDEKKILPFLTKKSNSEPQLKELPEKKEDNEKERGELKEGYCADFAVLSDDYFSIDDEKIKDITSLLTVVDGNIVHGSGRFSSHAPKLPEPLPEWSPVRFYGGYQSVR